jgi:type I restriction enzyme M protein
MGTAEYIGYEPSGRAIGDPGERTDLDQLIEDFFHREDLAQPEFDLFSYAREHYGQRSHRRKDQTIRGTARGLKTAFLVQLSETAERLDPPYYLFRSKSDQLLRSLRPLGKTVAEVRQKFRPRTDAELDAEYKTLSVSSDGTITSNAVVRGEDFKEMKCVRAGDIVYNPMRINIGSIGVVPVELDNGLVSPDYVVFRSTGLEPEFLVTLLRSPFYRMYVDVITTGSIRDRLYFRDLQNIRVPNVDVTQQHAIYESAQRVSASEHEQQSRLAAEKAVLAEAIHALVSAGLPGDDRTRIRSTD